jgi:hypothetical protein
MLGTWGTIVGILAIAVLFYRHRAAHWKAIAVELAEAVVEMEEDQVSGGAAEALVQAGREIGARDAAFEIMREQATGDPERIRADRTR